MVKILHGYLFLLESGGFLGGYTDETLGKLAKIAKQQQVNRVLVESNFGDGMFTQLLKPVMAKVHPVTMEEVKHSVQKEKRIIDTLEPFLNEHRLIVGRRLIEQDYLSTEKLPSEQSLRYQMTRITKDRGALAEYDRLDVLAMAVAYWVEQIARDVDMAIADEKERRLDEALQQFIGHVLGDTWMDV